MVPAVVTFDLFSALIDSRAGGSEAFGELARERGWPVDGATLYAHWDARNKAAQRDCAQWATFAELSGRALGETYRELGISADATQDAERILASVSQWPLWPDVADGLARIGRDYPVGILSNVDDDILRRTRAASLVDPDRALTSQRLAAYKPGPEIYHRAERRFAPLVHVASSARDVQGALRAGTTMIHLRRPGHTLDPQGPEPPRSAENLDELAERLSEITRG
ncbi:2-haloalkanoic acid dehalogenase type II [Lipingzhangella halophila]|uniref:2-haloalkanoic acid dehalogenase type II n=1 Tax=Lipingzhangella halophila TaxID=1783352 RepID=A0A7W7RM48_9ACTN|nr:HAD family hydrolase [Lipingzhangella halophila]MBB4934297.1 2-haloalkanoic acid dehalogenase type II [Lipingzhangella halophila]